eukprot:g1212.t1
MMAFAALFIAASAMCSSLDGPHCTMKMPTATVQDEPPRQEDAQEPPPSAGAVATLSSVYYGRVASICIDGKLGGVWPNVCHTEKEPQPWFELDLGVNQRIELIKIWNRKENLENRLYPLWVLLSRGEQPFSRERCKPGEHQCSSLYDAMQISARKWYATRNDCDIDAQFAQEVCTWKIEPDAAIRSRFVRLQIESSSDSYLHFGEILVE